MLTKRQAEEILLALKELPPEKVAEVQDFIGFLKERYGQGKVLDESDAWTEEDLHDLTAAVLNHSDQSLCRRATGVIGNLSQRDWREVQARLRVALAVD